MEILAGYKTKIAGAAMIALAVIKAISTSEISETDISYAMIGLGLLGIAYKIERE